jgi:hypothetical protein
MYVTIIQFGLRPSVRPSVRPFAFNSIFKRKFELLRCFWITFMWLSHSKYNKGKCYITIVRASVRPYVRASVRPYIRHGNIVNAISLSIQFDIQQFPRLLMRWAAHINDVSRHLIGLCCERDNSFNSRPIRTQLHIWPCCDIVSVKFDSQQFPRIMRCTCIWLVDVVNAIHPSIPDRFRRNFTYGLVVTLSRWSSTASNFCAYYSRSV